MRELTEEVLIRGLEQVYKLEQEREPCPEPHPVSEAQIEYGLATCFDCGKHFILDSEKWEVKAGGKGVRSKG